MSVCVSLQLVNGVTLTCGCGWSLSIYRNFYNILLKDIGGGGGGGGGLLVINVMQ